MPRRRRAVVREVLPDPVYNSTLVEKFVNSMMWEGKKNTAQGIFYQAMDKLRERTSDDPVKLFKKAVENAKPLLEVKTRRVGGANYQVPIEVPQNRRTSLAMRWIIGNARGRAEKGMADKLANELNDAANLRGGAIKKRDDVHRMAEANKAFAHYRWERALGRGIWLGRVRSRGRERSASLHTSMAVRPPGPSGLHITRDGEPR